LFSWPRLEPSRERSVSRLVMLVVLLMPARPLPPLPL